MKTTTPRYTPIGQIPKVWMQNATHEASFSDAPASLIEDWFSTASNCSMELSAEGSVWNSTVGAWLPQGEIDRLCEVIDRGV